MNVNFKKNSIRNILIIVLLTIVFSLSFSGINLLGEGKKSATIQTPEISTDVGEKVDAAPSLPAFLHSNWKSSVSTTNLASVQTIEFSSTVPNYSTYGVYNVGAQSLVDNTTPRNTVKAYLNSNRTILTFYSSSRISFPQNSSNLFDGLTALQSIEFNGRISTTGVQYFSYMFQNCQSLTELDLSGFAWDNAGISTGMFKNCYDLVTINMTGFVLNWDETSADYMFYECRSLTQIIGVENFGMSLVIYHNSMFEGCRSLTTLDLSGWGSDCYSDEMPRMFANCSSLTSLKFGSFQCAYNMSQMFLNCSSLKTLDISGFDTQYTQDMSSMFSGCSSLTSLNLSNFNTGYVTNMGAMFSDCSSLTSLDLSNFNTAKVTIMNSMFQSCSSLTSLDLSTINASSLTETINMFAFCSNLKTVDLSGSFDPTIVTDMEGMFQDCVLLQDVYMESWGVSNVIYMSMMFQNCSSLRSTYLDLGNWSLTSSLQYADYMFKGCSSLTYLDLSPFNLSGVDTTDMLTGCTSLNKIITPSSCDETALPNGNWYKTDGNGFILDSQTYTTLNADNVRMTIQLKRVITGAYLHKNWQDSIGRSTTKNATSIEFTSTWLDSYNNMTAYNVGASSATDTSSTYQGSVTAYVSGTTIKIYSPWTIYFPEDSSNLFSYVSSTSYFLTSLTNIYFNNINTSLVTSMRYMFSGCSALESINLHSNSTNNKTFDTSNVGDMAYMFNGCSTLTSLDLSNFKTENVTNLTKMFNGCQSMTSLNLNNWVISSSATVNIMLDGLGALNTIQTPKTCGKSVNLPTAPMGVGKGWYKVDSNDFAISGTHSALNSTNTSSTLKLGAYVQGVYLHKNWKNSIGTSTTSAATSIEFTNNLVFGTSYDVGASSATDTSSTYQGSVTACVSGTTIKIYSPFTIYFPENSSYLFNGLSAVESITFSNINTGSVTNMVFMFHGCSSLTSLNLSSFDTSGVTDMGRMFDSCSGLTSLDLSSFDTGSVTSMGSMFYGCKSLDSLDLSSFSTSSVTFMGSMFYGCSGLTSLNLSNFNTGSVTDMNSMFDSCSGLTSLDLSSFDTGSVTNMKSMFYGCSSLTSLNLSSFDTGSVTNMGVMFYGCKSLDSLNLSSFNTGSVTYMDSMFYGCSSLTSLDISGFTISSDTYVTYMFYNCTSLNTIITPKTCATTADLPNGNWYKVTGDNYLNTSASYTTLDSSNTGSTIKLGYTVALDNQGATTEGTTSVVAAYGVKMTSITAPTKNGYTFGGYFASTGGSGTQYYTSTGTSATTYNLTADTTLYAKWTAIDYTITVKPNGGSGGSVSPSKYNISANSQTATITLPTRTGYTLSSWTVSGHTGTIPTVSGTTLTIPANTYGNLTLTANWTVNKYVVSLDSQPYTNLISNPTFENVGWTGGTYSTDYKHSGTYSYKMTGTTSSNEVLAYNRTNITITAGHIYYASVWGYQATKTAGATVQCYWPIDEPSFGSVAVGDAGQWNLYSFRLIREKNNSGITWSGNYQLRFDFDNRKVDGVMYFDDAHLIDLTAIFGAGNEPDKAWCDANLSNMQAVIATYGEAMPSISVPVREGYTFAGYYDGANGTGTQYYTSTGASARTWNKTADATLYANWTVNTYTVTYNAQANGGTTSATSKTVAYGNAIDLTPTATKSGWTFVGWNTNKSATTKLTSLTMGTSNVTLYAIFSKTLTAHFKYYNNQTKDVSTTIYNTATQGSITSPDALGTPSGYSFRGWSTSNTANATISVNANASVTLTQDTTYYASYQMTVTATFYYCSVGKGTYSGPLAAATTTATATKYIGYAGTIVDNNFTVPTAVTSSIGAELAENYIGVSLNASSIDVVSPSTSHTTTSTITYYAVYTEDLVFYYYNGTKFTSLAQKRTVLYDSSTSKYVVSSTQGIPSTPNYDGATFQYWNYIADDYSNRRDPYTTGVNALYAVYSKSVTGTFNYYDGSKSASTTASATRYYTCTTSQINQKNANYTIPDAAKQNRSPYIYRGISTSETANATTITPTTANTTFYTSYTYSVTIKFDGNNATSGTAPSDITGTAYMNYAGTKIGISATMPENPFSRTGYTKGNWNSNTSGTGTTYTVGSSYTFTASATLYAVWTPNTNTAYKVYHYKEDIGVDATLTTSNCTLADTDSLTGTTASSVTPAVKTYTGFASPSTQTVTIAADGSTVVYYFYTRNTYTLTLTKGTGISSVGASGTGVSGGASPYTVDYGASVTLSASVQTGYTWSKWTQTSGGADVSTTQSYKFTMGTSNLSYTANAVDITKPTVSITRTDYNTFSWTSSDGVGVTGYAITTSSTTPTSWSSDKTSGTYDVTSAATYYVHVKDAAGNTNSASITAYTLTITQGTGTTLTVKGDGSSGTVLSSGAIVLDGTTIYATATANTGYKNVVLKDGSTTVDNPYTTTMSSNKTIQSSATLNTYTITVTVTTNTGDVANLTAQLGSYTSGTVSTTAGAGKTTTLTISNVPYGTTGNITLKWAVASGTYYYLISSSAINATQSSIGTASDTYTTIGSYTQGASDGSVSAYFSQLYAMSYDANGGSGAPATQYKVYGVNYTVSETAPITALTGFTFVGYATSSTSTTKVTTFTSNANQTFYAIWKKTLSATFYQLDGTTSTLSSDVYNGSTATTFTATTPTVKTSGSFTTIVGWGTSTTATSKTLDSNASSTISNGQNYYAICTYTVTLTYNANGKTLTNTLPQSQTSNRYATASGSSTPNYTGADFAISSTEPTATGYTFSKWNTEQNGLGTDYAVGGNMSGATANITLYAQWTTNSYTLTIDPNGGKYLDSENVTTITQEYGTTYNVDTPTRSGYNFISWTFTGEGAFNGSTNVFTFGTGNATLTATWQKAEVTVKLQYAVDGYTLQGLDFEGYYGDESYLDLDPYITADKLSSGTWIGADTTLSNFAGIASFNSDKSYLQMTYTYGGNVTLNISLGSEYQLTSLIVNGVTVSVTGTTYVIENVTEETTILAKFERKQVTITLSLVTNGIENSVLSELVSSGKYTAGVIKTNGTEISNGTIITKYYGDTTTFIIMPNSGFQVTSITAPKDEYDNVSMRYSIIVSHTISGTLAITFTEQDTWLNYASEQSLTSETKITTPEQLARLALDVLLGNTVPSSIMLGGNIDLSKHNWFPIGTSSNAFASNFDGDSFTISSMNVLNGTAIGLFGYNSGTVYNVKLSGSSTGGQIVGGVVGHNSGKIAYVANNVSVVGKSTLEEATNAVGGVTGYNAGNIFASYNSATVQGTYYVGGIAGYNSGTIMNAYNTETIANSSVSTNSAVGGIVGYTTNTNVGYIYNIGTIVHGGSNTPYSNFAGNRALTLPRYYLETLSASSFDSGCGLPKQEMQPASTTEFNNSTYFGTWNLATNNGYKDNIWEINPQDNNNYMYPVFVIQKAFVGTLTITTTFGDTAESQAVAFVKVETSRGTYSIILFRGKTYTISKLEENSTVTISVTSTINHKATASQTSITITQQSNSVSILVEKVGVGTFYAGTELSYTVQQEVLSTQAVSEPIVQDTIEEIVEIETEEELAEQTCEEDNEHSDNTEIDSCSNDVFDLAYEQKKYIMFHNKKEQKLYL